MKCHIDFKILKKLLYLLFGSYYSIIHWYFTEKHHPSVQTSDRNYLFLVLRYWRCKWTYRDKGPHTLPLFLIKSSLKTPVSKVLYVLKSLCHAHLLFSFMSLLPLIVQGHLFTNRWAQFEFGEERPRITLVKKKWHFTITIVF